MALSAFVIRILLLAVPGILASKVYKKMRGRPAREAWESALEILIFSLAAYSIVHLAGGDHREALGRQLIVRVIPPFSVQSPQPVRFTTPTSYSVLATQPTMILPISRQKPASVEIQVLSPVAIASTQPIEIDGSATSIAPNQTITIEPAQTGSRGSSVFEAFLNEQVPIGDYVRTIAWATATALMLALVAAYLHHYGVINFVAQKLRATNRSGDEDAWTFFNNSDDVQWVFVRDFANNRVYYGAVKQYSDSEKPKEVVLENVHVYTQDTDELLYCVQAVFLSRDDDDWTIEVPEATDNNVVPSGDADADTREAPSAELPPRNDSVSLDLTRNVETISG